ncbi:MAG: hypothetical protein QXS93_04065 [Candidatus Micrarchaeia archaeon]
MKGQVEFKEEKVSIADYAYAYVMSQKSILKIINAKEWKISVVLAVIALIVVALPARQPLSLFDYAYNFALIGGGLVIINALVSGIIYALFKRKFAHCFFSMLKLASTTLIINAILLLLLYVVGLPFGASQTLLAAAATLISTYYFAVLLAIIAGYATDASDTLDEKIRKHIVEIATLLLWYAFTFYLLPLTL